MIIKVSDILSNRKDTTTAKIHGNRNNIWKNTETNCNNTGNKNNRQYIPRYRWPVGKLQTRQTIVPTQDRRQRAASRWKNPELLFSPVPLIFVPIFLIPQYFCPHDCQISEVSLGSHEATFEVEYFWLRKQGADHVVFFIREAHDQTYLYWKLVHKHGYDGHTRYISRKYWD